jgi:hypothetical protein
MKTRTILGMVAALAMLPSVAFAEDVIIRDNGPDATPPPPGVTIEHRDRAPGAGIEERDTNGAGPADDNCRRTTVRKEDADGHTTTIRKKECD